jgi:hypothetical protein
VWKRFEAQEGQSRRSRVIGPSDLHVTSCIGDSQVKAPSCCNENCDIAIRDIPTRSEPSISGDTCQEIPGVGVRRIGVFKDKKLLQLGIAIRDIPTGESCGPQQEIVEDRWHSIGDREKVSPESFGIRIRDPANSEIPIEVTGVERLTHTCIGVSAHRVSGVGNSKCMTSRVAKSR